MSVVQVFSLGDDGNITGTEQFLPDYDVIFIKNNVRYSAAVVTHMELTGDEDSDELVDQCLRTEVRSSGIQPWTLVVEGLVTATEPAQRERDSNSVNLSHNILKSFKDGGSLYISSKVHSGSFKIERISITDPVDIHSIDVGHGEEYAFQFQMQLKEV